MKIFVMNYNDLHDQMGPLTGQVMDQLNESTEFENGVCAVNYDDEGYCLFETHSIEGNWRRVEFTGTAK